MTTPGRASPRPLRLLNGAAFVDSVGTGLFLAGAAVFYVKGLGIPAGEVGVVLSAAALVGLLTTVPLTARVDRWGARTALVVLQLLRAAVLVALAFAGDLLAFAVVAVLLAVVEGPVTPVTQALVGGLTDDATRTASLARMRAVRNTGFAVGSLCAVPILASAEPTTYRAIVLGNAVSYVVMAVVLRRRPDLTAPVAAARRSVGSAWRSVPFVRLTVLHGLLSLHMTVLAVGLPVWVALHTDAPVALAAVLVTVNTVLAVAFQVRFAVSVERPGAAGRSLRRAGAGLAVASALVAASAVVGEGRSAAVVDTVLLLLAVLALTAGELWHSAGAWEASFAGAPVERRTEYLSFFSLGGGAQEVVGPVLLTGVVMAAGGLGWVGLAVLFLAAGLAAPRVVGALRPQPVAAVA